MRGVLDGSLHLNPREYPQEILLQPHPKLNKQHRCILCGLVQGLVPEPPDASQPRLFSPEEFSEPSNRRYFLKIRATDIEKRASEVNLNSFGLVFDNQHRFYGSVYLPLSCSLSIRNRLDPKKLKTWLNQCELGHLESRSGSNALLTGGTQMVNHKIMGPTSPESDRLATPFASSKAPQPSIDLTLIDVIDQCIVRGSSKDRYLALSYVWGGVRTLQLFTSTRTALETHGSLTHENSDIPRTIRDAIKLVQDIGERYLWVDCLCIEQDNTVQKHFQISRMDVVYSCALATIVSLASSNAADPIPGVVQGTRLPFSSRWVPDSCDEVESTSKNHAISFASYPPLPESIFNDSVYERRGWTLQERLLSRRCIYFTHHMAYFSCHHGKISCDADELFAAQHRVDNRKDSRLQAIINPMSLGSESTPEAAKFELTLTTYTALVHQYTKRDLSFSEDKLNAFSGILSAVIKPFPGSFLGGLPEYLLDYALLWVQTKPQAINIGEQGRDQRFPSWFWAGWIGEKSYYNGPLYLNDFLEKGFSIGDRMLKTNLVSELKDVGSSIQTPIRPLTRITDNRSNCAKLMARTAEMKHEILHFTAEVVSMERLRLGDHNIRTGFTTIDIRGQHDCGVLYPCTWINICSGRTDGRTEDVATLNPFFRTGIVEIVLLSRVPCPLHASDPTNLGAMAWLESRTHSRYCLSENCCLLHVMFVEWDGEYVERCGIGTMQIGAWRELERSTKKVMLR